jgi:HAD superfamily hydrolase (TIGR01509 family)
MSVLKGILIDFGGTIAKIDEEDDRRFIEEIVSVLKGYGYEKTLEEVARLLHNEYRGSTKGEVKKLEEFWNLFSRDLSIPENLKLVSELIELQRSHLATVYRLYDGAIQVLSVLKEKYVLALVSNCVIGMSNVIEALGLSCFFEAVVLSYEVGVRKPDTRIYLEALQRLRLNPDQCAFVADEISDLEGAREVGLKTILVRQSEMVLNGAKDPNFRPNFQCSRISEILQFL